MKACVKACELKNVSTKPTVEGTFGNANFNVYLMRDAAVFDSEPAYVLRTLWGLSAGAHTHKFTLTTHADGAGVAHGNVKGSGQVPQTITLTVAKGMDAGLAVLAGFAPALLVSEIEVVDKTKMFGRNSTRVCTDGSETEVMTKARKKPFMLSAETDDHSATLICRLISRGPGFFTRQERFLSAEDTLVERHRLKRPGQEDVVVERIFTRDISKHEDLSLAPRAENAHTHGTSLNPVIGELLTRDAKDQ